MQTKSICISTLCIPCENRCRYCLLSWDGKLLGADYDRSQLYAERFWQWLKEKRPEISFQFYYGYSMEHFNLTDAIDFAKKTGSAGGQFLQVNGLKFREKKELSAWLNAVQDHGIRAVDLTFYGTKDYHDRFAGRKGEFDYMLLILSEANALGLDVDISIPITSENAGQMELLMDLFENYCINNLRIFIPHREGRGASLEGIRLAESELKALAPRVQGFINTKRYKSESQWLREGTFSVPENRMLGLVLTPEKLIEFEGMPFEAVINYLESLDDTFYQKMPPLEVLARRYGDPDGEKLFSERDLYLFYQSKFMQENHQDFYDINDERHCFSRRY